MRVNVGLPGPFSVNTKAPSGCGPLLLAALAGLFILCMVGCCIGQIQQASYQSTISTEGELP